MAEPSEFRYCPMLSTLPKTWQLGAYEQRIPWFVESLLKGTPGARPSPGMVPSDGQR